MNNNNDDEPEVVDLMKLVCGVIDENKKLKHNHQELRNKFNIIINLIKSADTDEKINRLKHCLYYTRTTTTDRTPTTHSLPIVMIGKMIYH